MLLRLAGMGYSKGTGGGQWAAGAPCLAADGCGPPAACAALCPAQRQALLACCNALGVAVAAALSALFC